MIKEKIKQLKNKIIYITIGAILLIPKNAKAANPQGAANSFLDFVSYAAGVLGVLWMLRGAVTVGSGLKTENPQKRQMKGGIQLELE